MPDHDKALKPEDLTRLFVERANDGDAAGIAALYEEQAVMAYPPGRQTVGRDAIRALWENVLASASRNHLFRPYELHFRRGCETTRSLVANRGGGSRAGRSGG